MLPIVAYLNEFSIAPGEEVQVMVGSYGANTYRADLRRIIQGDTNPEGPGYREEKIELDLGGVRKARPQAIRPGSYVRIETGGVLDGLKSFTISVIIWPTRLGRGEQGLFDVYSADQSSGVRIMLDTEAKPSISICSGGKILAQLVADESLIEKRWTLVAASYNALSGKLLLFSAPLDFDFLARKLSLCKRKISRAWRGDGLCHVKIAALEGRDRHARAHFDGKIDSPVVFNRAIEPRALIEIMAHPDRIAANPALLAYWDFSHAMEGNGAIDRSPYRLDGVLVNCPARAMTGWRWRAETLCRWDRPDLYSAVHFHSDDLYDAEWEVDFSFRLSRKLKSGVYAVHIVPDGRDEDAYYAIFAVRPPRHRPTGNSVAFLLPTASYLAYANHRLGLDVPGTEVGMGRAVEIDRHHAFLQEHPEFGFSFYEVHNDGSGVFFSSRKRPVVDMQPKIKGFLGGLGSNLWQFNADTHILGWLDHHGIDCDVITDEDLHKEGLSLLRRYRVVLTGTHPEYYSVPMFDAMQGFVDRGGRLMYLGGNGFYWRISYSDALPGIIECRRSEAGIRPWEPGHGQYYHQFTREMGGLWRRNGRTPNSLAGVGMTSQGFDISEPYSLTAESKDPRVRFMFAGIEKTAIGAFGLSGGGAAGLEVDRADRSLGTPPHALVVGTSTRHTDVYLMVPEEILDPTPDMCGTQNDLIRSDLTFFETPGGGAVFSAGSIAWAGAMAWNRYRNEISQLSLNVLKRFNDPKSFSMPKGAYDQ